MSKKKKAVVPIEQPQSGESTPIKTGLDFDDFYRTVTGLIKDQIDVSPGTPTFWDYVRFYNATAVLFPEKCSELIHITKAARRGTEEMVFSTIPNTNENRAIHCGETKEPENVERIEIGIGTVPDPTLALLTDPSMIPVDAMSDRPTGPQQTGTNSGMWPPPPGQAVHHANPVATTVEVDQAPGKSFPPPPQHTPAPLETQHKRDVPSQDSAPTA